MDKVKIINFRVTFKRIITSLGLNTQQMFKKSSPCQGPVVLNKHF